MRAIERRKPREETAENRAPTLAPPRRYRRPTFDLTESNWITNATLRSLENKWQKAVKDHDADALDKLLSDNFEATSANGSNAGKTRVLNSVRNDKNVYRSARAKSMTINMKRPGVAVVTGISIQSGTKEDGEKFSSKIQFTDTWRLQKDGQWVCVASEATKSPKR
ncbi:MAG: nuclear transport factor 2 family protein [Verrucomicrobiota bacterium]|nr:nuclear transport factor 2 family protein [Verrucomicrobiota bacterium]